MDIKKLTRISNISKFITVMVVIISAAVFFSISRIESITFMPEEGKVFSTEWYIDGSDKAVGFPARLTFPAKGKITLSAKIPEDVRDVDAIFYNCSYCSQKIYVDQELIWTYATEKQLPFGNMRGSAYALVPMKEAYAGKTLTIEMWNPYNKTASDFAGVTIGANGELKYKLLMDNKWRLDVFIIFGAIALFAYVVAAYRKIRSVDYQNDALVYFALMVFSVGSWLVVDPSVVQFYMPYTTVTQYLSFVALILIGSFYMGLCACLFKKEARMFRVMELAGYVMFALMLLLYVTNIVDPVGFMMYIYIYAILYLVISFVVSIVHFKDYMFSKAIFWGTIILLLGVGGAIVVFLMNPMRDYAVISFTISFAIYIFILFVIMLRDEIKMIQSYASSSMYQKMAYTDQMTKVPNRAAFERKLDEIEEECKQKKKEHKLQLAIFDLNNLKKTNDELGHEVGDELICAATKCLQECFGEYGDTYRLGGDEFAVLLVDFAIPMNTMLERLEKQMEVFNRSQTKIKLSMAYGYAEDTVTEDKDSYRKTLYRTADERMYEHKQKFHHR